MKSKYDIKTRVDTNGLVKCIYENPVRKLEKAGLDEIRISLNAVNGQEYNQLCRPKFKNAFQNLISFVKECLDSNIDTYVSFVIGFADGKIKNRNPKEYINFATSLGIKPKNIILREHVKPIESKLIQPNNFRQ